MQIEKVNRREIENLIKKNYGAEIDLSDVIVFETGNDRKIWIASKEISAIDFSKLRINSLGLYFGKIKRNEKMHLSIEGCQLVGKKATRNIMMVDDEQAKRFMQGFDIEVKEEIDCEQNNFVLVKHDDDFIGMGKLSNTCVENLIPKSRRAEVAESG